MNIGQFEIGQDYIFGSDSRFLFKWLEFVPLRVEHVGYNSMLEYRGISRHFRDIELGEIIPTYKIVVSSKKVNDLIMEHTFTCEEAQ